MSTVARRALRAIRAAAAAARGRRRPPPQTVVDNRDEPVLEQLGGLSALRWTLHWMPPAELDGMEPDAWIVVARADAQLDAAAAHALVAAAERAGASAVQPVILDSGSGTVLDAGHAVVRRSAPPWRILESHPEADLPRDPFVVDLLSGPIVAVRVAIAREMPAGVGVEAALAVATAGRSGLVVPSVRCWSSPVVEALPEARALNASPEHAPAVALHDAGLAIDGWWGGPIKGFDELLNRNELAEGMRRVRPRLRRSDARRRWAIRIGAPAGPEGDGWGDTPFAESLAASLTRAGERAFVDRRGAIARPSSDYLDDVTVSIRGLYRMPTNPASCNVLWVISHPDWVTLEELESYDLVFAASEPWARQMSERADVPVFPLLQATDPSRFEPGGIEDELQEDVLFVGRSRAVFRPIVRDALEAGAELGVYGDGWETFIDSRHVRGQSLPYARAGAAYRSARRVLNDHWADMAASGFLSNRLFDAVAAGARVVTDRIDGLERFGGAVRAYGSIDELRALLREDEGWPSDAAIAQVAARVRAEDSFDVRAARLIELVEGLER